MLDARQGRKNDSIPQDPDVKGEVIEALLYGYRTRIQLSNGRLTKRIVFENPEGAVQRRRGGKDESVDCVQNEVGAFGIAGTGDWKATALKEELWTETVTEGSRRCMAT